MLYKSTLSEIRTNINTGIEYEIALFYTLLTDTQEKKLVYAAIEGRDNSETVKRIISETNNTQLLSELRKRNLSIEDVSFETQNDEVGPSDIVLHLEKENKEIVRIGLSVKYANTCTLNVTGRNFITDNQISQLRSKLPEYTDKYIKEMTHTWGGVENWFRKRKPSRTTDEYIDLVRDAVISNWKNVTNKTELLKNLFHSNSPIEFWVVTYTNNGYKLKTVPATIDVTRVNDIVLKKYQTSYVAFYLDDQMVGHMQVKFNNGFIEKCKKINPDITWEGVKMAFGQPFSSWNFSVEE